MIDFGPQNDTVLNDMRTIRRELFQIEILRANLIFKVKVMSDVVSHVQNSVTYVSAKDHNTSHPRLCHVSSTDYEMCQLTSN
jgi:hypothetical protein